MITAIKIKKDKKALSEMVSYILLVVIAIGLSVGIYSWLRGQLPSESEEKCSEDVAITIRDYDCDTTNDIITLTLENSGMFNIQGVYARGANEIGKITTLMLDSPTKLVVAGEGISTLGRYDFSPSSPLKIGKTKEVKFYYNFTAQIGDKLEKIQIQPFVNGKTNLLLCDNVVDLKVNACT